MGHRHTLASLAIVTALAAACVLLPGCRRAPEEAPAPPETTQAPEVAEVEVPLTALELPQTNPEIGITIKSAPEGLVATYNGEHWIELADRDRPRLRFTFVSAPEFAPGLRAVSFDEFESAVRRYKGRFTGRGEIDTPLGPARWVNGSFSEDGEEFDQVLVAASHPSGARELFITANCPSGVASVEERLEMIRRLFADVS